MIVVVILYSATFIYISHLIIYGVLAMHVMKHFSL